MHAGDPKHAHLMALDGAVERLRLFKADMLDHASVAAAVAGCDGVFHVASPVPASKPADPELEVVAPAVDGTRNVLRACHDANVRRVVVVSSVAAIAVNPKCPNGIVLDEEWWSDEDFCRTIKVGAVIYPMHGRTALSLNLYLILKQQYFSPFFCSSIFFVRLPLTTG